MLEKRRLQGDRLSGQQPNDIHEHNISYVSSQFAGKHEIGRAGASRGVLDIIKYFSYILILTEETKTNSKTILI